MKFYTKNEIQELKRISTLDGQDRRNALERLSLITGRPLSSLQGAVYYYTPKVIKKRIDGEATMVDGKLKIKLSKNRVEIPFNNISIENNTICFHF